MGEDYITRFKIWKTVYLILLIMVWVALFFIGAQIHEKIIEMEKAFGVEGQGLAGIEEQIQLLPKERIRIAYAKEELALNTIFIERQIDSLSDVSVSLIARQEELDDFAAELNERLVEVEAAEYEYERRIIVSSSTGYPSGLGVFKSYMDYRMITHTGSPQYRLQHNGNAYTGDYGIRYYNGLPMVAVASTLGVSGEMIRVTFSSGIVADFMIGDTKAGTNYAHPDGSVIEFIVDADMIPDSVRNTGSFNSIYGGSVEKVERIY